MDILGIFFNNLTNLLFHQASNKTAVVNRVHGQLFLQCNEQLQTHFNYTNLCRLQCRFGHPHVEKLVNFLKRANSIPSTSTPVKCLSALIVPLLRVNNTHNSPAVSSSLWGMMSNSTILSMQKFSTSTVNRYYTLSTKKPNSNPPFGWKKYPPTLFGRRYDDSVSKSILDPLTLLLTTLGRTSSHAPFLLMPTCFKFWLNLFPSKPLTQCRLSNYTMHRS